MAGALSKNLKIRTTPELHARVFKCMAETKLQPEQDVSDVVRWGLSAYCDFVEANNRRPTDGVELCEWYLAQQKKKK